MLFIIFVTPTKETSTDCLLTYRFMELNIIIHLLDIVLPINWRKYSLIYEAMMKIKKKMYEADSNKKTKDFFIATCMNYLSRFLYPPYHVEHIK